ncbi:hypothetical protein CBL_11571 [Carabus blaptoides fortunei]
MHPFVVFMDVENSRTYIDELYSPDSQKCLESIIYIKNSVIGSNRQKGSVIAQGIVPRLMQLIKDKNTKSTIRLEAVVTLGSLAKGTEEHIKVLIECGTVPLLLEVLEENDSRIVEAALCCLRTFSQQGFDSLSSLCTQKQLSKLLSLASSEQTVVCQACVANVLGASCRTTEEQTTLCTSGASQILATLLTSPYIQVQIPALNCLANMCFENHVVAMEIVNTTCNGASVPDLLVWLMSRDRPIEMQLAAARCVTYLHRSEAIEASDSRVVYRTLPCLVRLCQREHAICHRATAAETLAYLTEVDSELQRTAAISNHLVSALANLLNQNSECGRQGAFKAFASLGANDEDIRKRIIETDHLMEQVLAGLADECANVRLAAVRCLHSLSRSVQQLRTSFQDHSVWRPLMALLTSIPPPCDELLTVASSTLCNLLLEFSPAKEPILEQGAVQLLCSLTNRPEPSLKLNGIWALMNMAFQAEQRIKSQILITLGTDQIFRLLADTDTRVLMKTLGLIRNLVSPRTHTDSIMALHSTQVMQAVVLVLEGPHSIEVKEQALCILGNIADGERAKEHIMANEDVLKKLINYMTHANTKLQAAAIFCIGNLARRGEIGATERQAKLKELGVLTILQQLVTTSDTLLFDKVKAAMTQFTDP